MLFKNEPIDIALLPDVETTPMHAPHPNYLKVIQLGTTVFLLFLLTGICTAFFIAKEVPFPYFFALLLGVWALVALSSYWYGWRSFRNQSYGLRQKDILYKRGVLVQSWTSIPFNRIQHCEIKQGPIERLYGLKTLEVFTAGGSGSDLEIPGLAGETAQQVKEYIIKTTTTDGNSEEE